MTFNVVEICEMSFFITAIYSRSLASLTLFSLFEEKNVSCHATEEPERYQETKKSSVVKIFQGLENLQLYLYMLQSAGTGDYFQKC